ncbi:hypothetical protein ACFL2T_05720 [Elusimicrobiota bacterium]
MAHELRALIADKTRLKEMMDGLGSAEVLDLYEDLGIVPLTKDLLSEIDSKDPGKGKPVFPDLSVSPALADRARDGSASGPVAYVETDYRKGRDHQAGVVWSESEISVGPLSDDTGWDPRESPLQDRPVNEILRALDVPAGDSGDEWDTAGLSRHRRTEEWI